MQRLWYRVPANRLARVIGRHWLVICALLCIALVTLRLIMSCWIPDPVDAEVRVPFVIEKGPMGRFQIRNITKVRNVATVTTCFTRETSLHLRLYDVRNGTATFLTGFGSGRSGKLTRPSDPYLMTLAVTFALVDSEGDGRHLIHAVQHGALRAGAGDAYYEPFAVQAQKTFTGCISPGAEYLLYIEGDRQFAATSTMTVEEFAAMHSGRFLVATILLKR